MSPPKQTITEPLDEWVERVIDRALDKHIASCPLSHRVRAVEMRMSSLIGYMVGSGVVSGAGVMGVMKLLGG